MRRSRLCQNCGGYVTFRYCSECGQENIINSTSFLGLLRDFISTFVNVDGSWPRTLGTLFSKPGKLSVEYMAGRRARYIKPAALYLFANFLAFFNISFISFDLDDGKNIEIADVPTLNRFIEVNNLQIQTVDFPDTHGEESQSQHTGQDLIRESDPAESPVLYPPESVVSITEMYRARIMNSIYYTPSLINNLAKFLIAFLPVFAFVLWLFNRRSRRYYFDSGIFTLHHFSLVLFMIIIWIGAIEIADIFMDDHLVNFIAWSGVGSALFIFAYFVISYWKFYSGRSWIKIVKIGFISIICLLLFLTIFIIYLLILAELIWDFGVLEN